MLKALRRRLALLFVLLTLPVLTAALGAGVWLYRQQQREAADALFLHTARSLCDSLTEAQAVKDSWLAQRQQAVGGILDLQDNGNPTRFSRHNRQDAATAALLDQAAARAAEAGLDGTLTGTGDGTPYPFVTFPVTDAAGRAWRGAAATLPRGGTHRLDLLVLQPAGLAFGVGPAVFFAALWLAGAGLLTGAGWLLAGRMLHPVGRAWQRQNEFIAAAGHELRSPLAVIKASLDAAGNAAPEQQERFLAAARRETDRLALLTDDLLVLAAGEAGALAVHPGPVAPDTLCIELYEQFYLLAREREHPLTLDLPESPLPPLRTDAPRLTQLLSILLQNALDHTPPGTPVTLTLRREGGRRPVVRFSVTDHGPGIPDGCKAAVFDRFYRGDASRTRKQNFGLGLSVARELARLLGAALTLEDTPGGGATFTVELRDAPSPSRPAGPGEPSAPTGTPPFRL